MDAVVSVLLQEDVGSLVEFHADVTRRGVEVIAMAVE